TMRLWDVNSRKPTAALKGHEESVTSVTFSPNGKLLASGSRDGTVRLWKLPSRKADKKGSVMTAPPSPILSAAPREGIRIASPHGQKRKDFVPQRRTRL